MRDIFGSLKRFAKNQAQWVRHIKAADANILVFVGYGFFYDLVMNIYKPFVVKFMDRIGGNEFHISLYNSLPGVAAIFAILPGAMFINRFRRKKGVTTVFLGLGRLIIPLLVLVPFLPHGSSTVTIFVIMMASMNFFDAVGQSSLQGMLGSIFGGRTRAKAIALRNRFGNVSILIITVITGLLITFVPKNDGQTIVLYQVFFVAAFAAGLAEIFIFSKFKEKEESAARDSKITLKLIMLPFKDKKFLGFMAPTLFFYFFWHLGWPMGGVFQVKTLQANEFGFAALAVTAGIGAVVAAGYWGKFIIKKGNDLALVIAALGLAGNQLLMTICPNIVVMIIINFYAGAVTVGMTTALLNGLLEATPDENRVVYIGVYNTLVNVSLAITPFLSYWLQSQFTIRPAMAISGAMRIVAAAVLFAKMKRQSLVERAD